MKKFVSLFLVVALCITVFPLQTFATEDCVHPEKCSHTDHVKEDAHTERALVCTCSNPVLDGSTIVTTNDGYVSHNSNYHKMRYKHTGLCLICGKTATVYTYGPLVAHATSIIYAAECDGTWQTHYCHCPTCGGNDTIRRVRCPAGPHTGLCPVLPV